MFQRKQKKNHRYGFSLFEILIFVIVWSLLAVTSYLVVPPILVKVRDVQRKSDLHKISQALEQYYESKKEFPDTLPDCGRPLSLASTTILSSIPCDPSLKTPYLYQKTNSSYRLYANLENEQDPIIATIKCHFGCGPDCAYNYGISSTNILLENCLPEPIIYACSPGGGCDQYDNPQLSQCPLTYPDDPICNNECNDPKKRCKNASGKHVPE